MPWASPGSARGARRALVVPPYAGGTAQTFASTLRDIAADHDVWYLALPGRTHRASEPPATDLAALLAGVRDALIALGRLTTLLGYSLGARMALALAHLCRGGPVELRGVVAAMFDTGPDHDQRPTGLDKVVADLRRHHPHGRALDEAGLLDRGARQTLDDLVLVGDLPAPATPLAIPVIAGTGRDRPGRPDDDCGRHHSVGLDDDPYLAAPRGRWRALRDPHAPGRLPGGGGRRPRRG